MAYKVLGQAAPAATTPNNTYTVRPNGATQADQHYLAYDVPIAANDSTTLTLGITMDAADVLTFYASSADMSINVFGTEIA
jgi:hypothetical protein